MSYRLAKESKELRKIFLAQLNRICGYYHQVGVFLSGGIDSNAVLFGLLELGKDVTAYSFRVDRVASTDLLQAKSNADT